MSAAVCGSKRSFLEDIPSPPSASVSKKLRRCSPPSPSSVHFSPPPSILGQLQSLFPHIDPQLLESVLLECSNDIDTAIKRLRELCIGAAGVESDTVEELGTTAELGMLTNDGQAVAASVSVQNPLATENLPVDGAEWAISNRAFEEAAKTFLKEKVMLKEQVEVLIQENRVLKRAVAIQHERQKEYQDKNHELQQLRQLVSQYQEQLRTLEMNNFTLTMHLRQTQ
ncbi:hypothetical protein V6N11_002791 [Hibiscus sabdariffa]|uniref:CUE domain-containing protein n=1 Tax=Hibiscus sabdariffa TaxID=183260 RepID=A0ABR2SBR6_9ROSI